MRASATAGVRDWLLIEHPGPWGRGGYKESGLSEAVVARLRGWEEAFEGLRIQLVRQGSAGPGGGASGCRVWWQHSADPPWARSRRLDTLEDLLELDPSEQGWPPGTDEVREPSPRILVCTHGRRDACCAKFGTKLYQALGSRWEVEEEVWQTTHLGGHRFAPTAVVFPHGLMFGRVQLTEVDALVQALKEDRIYRLDRFRGRTCWSEPAQAAEHFVRERMGLDGRLDVHSEEVSSDGPTWRVHVRTADTVVRVTLERENTGVVAPRSCADAPEPVTRWRLVAWEGS